MHTIQEWKNHIIFWAGAISVGLAAYAFAIGSKYMTSCTMTSPHTPLCCR